MARKEPRMGMFQSPGFLTDVQESKNLRDLAALGYKWISYQVQNDTQTKNRDLSAAREAGLSPGAWGVSYSRENLVRDAQSLRAQADSVGAEHIIFNVESPFDPTPFIDVFASYAKPKALIYLLGDTEALRTDVLVDAGWTLMPEVYYNDQETTSPSVAKWYLDRAQVPETQRNYCLGMYNGLRGTISGAEYADLLAEAGITNAFSAYMVEHGTMQDYYDLSRQISTPKELLEKLKLTNTGINAVLDNLEKVFDANGIGEPDGIDALRAHLKASGEKINELVDAFNAS
jgi:hypothetical protein